MSIFQNVVHLHVIESFIVDVHINEIFLFESLTKRAFSKKLSNEEKNSKIFFQFNVYLSLLKVLFTTFRTETTSIFQLNGQLLACSTRRQ